MTRALAPLLLLLAGCASPATVDRPARTGPEWQPWSAATFARAKAEGRLIYVNVAAGWCHWCHVMDDETLRDPAVLEELDRRWVAIRVDADARPDLAERWLDWGWPASALLAPDARRLAERRGFQPAADFAALLARLADAHDAGTLVPEPPGAAPRAAPADLTAALAAARAQLDLAFDPSGPAWGKVAQRYPLAAPIEHAFQRAALRPEERAWRERALQVLRAEWQLVDAVGGGMFQYSDDGTWSGGIHFEKLASVNAGALESFGLAYRLTGDAWWRERGAAAVARWVTTTLRRPDGTFGASQDADPPGGRGADYYRLYSVERDGVPAPRVDARAYADLNGLLAAGLARLSMATGDPGFAAAGAAALERILETHALPGGGLRHAAAGDDALYLADQAGVAWGCLALHEATGELRWLEAAADLGRVLLTRLEDRERGGFFSRTSDPAAAGDLGERRRPLRENALAARVLLALEAHTGDAAWGQAARRALLAVAPDAPSWGRLVGEHVVALEEALLAPLALKVHARRGDAQAAPLLAAARRAWAPRLALQVVTPEAGAAPFAVVCGAGACSSPITDPAGLQAAVDRFASSVRR